MSGAFQRQSAAALGWDRTGRAGPRSDSPVQSHASGRARLAVFDHASRRGGRSDSLQYSCCVLTFCEVTCVYCVLTSPSRSHRAKSVPRGPDLRGVRLVGGAYPFPNLPPLLSHRELCPGTAPAHLPAPPQRLPA